MSEANGVVHKNRALVLAGAALCLGAIALSAQTAPQSNACPPVRDAQGNLVSTTNCAPNAPAAPAAERFPYPGETAPSEGPPANAAPSAPEPQTGGATQAPAGKRFPYPGEDEAPASPQPNGDPGAAGSQGKAPLQDAGSSGSSSSSSSSSSGSSSTASGQDDAGAGANANDPDANDPAAIPRSKRHKLPAVPRQSPSEREQEDVQVAGFYFNDGNYRGSYDRAKDAVLLDSEDPAAQLALGNAARKMGKLDEAERAYKRCLELDPVPKLRKPAEKALHEMTGNS